MICSRNRLTRRLRNLGLAVAFAASAVLTGCATPGGSQDVRLEPVGRYISYNQTFAAAWCSVNDQGQYDLVLVDQPLPTDRVAVGPLQPATGVIPLQIMHVRVAWLASSATRANFPAATNASINWYVIDNQNPHDVQYLHYQGAGLVKVDSGGRATDFDIQSAPISLRHAKGELRDPVGAARLSGRVTALNDAVRTTDTLADLEEIFRQAESQTTRPAATEPSGTPPARGHTGP